MLHKGSRLLAPGSWHSAAPLLPFACLLFVSLSVAAGTPATPVFDVPKLDNITIDGKADDWGERGFRVDILADAFGKVPPAKDFTAKFRLGWNENGLLVLVTVTDDVFLEPATKPEELWKGDSIEFFMCTERGGNESYQVVVAPGCDPNSPEIRTNISDYRKTKGEKLTLEVARTKTDKGYVMEALLPWKNLAIEPQEGKEVGFQLYANDSDKVDQRTQLLWYPVPEAHSDTNRMYLVRLAAKPSGAVQATVFGAYNAEGKAVVSVAAVPELKGKKVKVREGEKKEGEGKLESEDGAATVKIVLKSRDKDRPYGPLTVQLEDEVLTTITLPEPPAK